MNIVSYGGGTNSTAMLIKMVEEKIPVDVILFADTGGERPETYAYVKMFSAWLVEHGYPEITPIRYGNETLEGELLRLKNLPPPAYGWKSCSIKYKIRPFEKYVDGLPEAQEIWQRGEKITKFIGYDAGEERRKDSAFVYDLQDRKYTNTYPLIDRWDMDREACVETIRAAGLPVPGKSSCFFCPNTKKKEIYELRDNHPDLLKRALAIEANAADNLKTVKGLGRDWAWRDLIYGKKDQVKMCGFFDDDPEMPCGCYDG